MSILGASKHPVLIKKISLSLWLLRDEVEAIIQKRLELNSDNNESVDLQELAKEYAFSAQAKELAQKNIEASEKEELGDGEDDMTAALAEAATPESKDEQQETNTADKEICYVEQRKPLLLPNQMINGSSFLAEINISEMFFFASQEFLIGQSVVIEFNIPRQFIINATIFYCRPYNMKSRIISNNPLPYRIGVKFALSKEGERTILREFLQSIEPDLDTATQQAAPAADNDDDDDILDGLDDDL